MRDYDRIIAEAKNRGRLIREIQTLMDAIREEKNRIGLPDSKDEAPYELLEGDDFLQVLIANEIGLRYERISELMSDGVMIEEWPDLFSKELISPESLPVLEALQKEFELDAFFGTRTNTSSYTLNDYKTALLTPKTLCFKDVVVDQKKGDILFEVTPNTDSEIWLKPFGMYEIQGTFYQDKKPLVIVQGDLHFSPYDLKHMSDESYLIEMDCFSDHDADFASAVIEMANRGEMGLTKASDLYCEGEGESPVAIVKWRTVAEAHGQTNGFDLTNALVDMTSVFEENFTHRVFYTVELLSYAGLPPGKPVKDLKSFLWAISDQENDPLFFVVDPIKLVACLSELHRIPLYMFGTKRRLHGISIEDYTLITAKHHALLSDFIKRKQAKGVEGTEYRMMLLNPATDYDPDDRVGKALVKHQGLG